MYYTKQEEQKARIKSAMIVVGILCVTFFVMALFVSYSNDEGTYDPKGIKEFKTMTSASTDLNQTKECTETVQGSKKTIRCNQ